MLQGLSDERLPVLGSVEGLVYALVDSMQSASDTLFRQVHPSGRRLFVRRVHHGYPHLAPRAITQLASDTLSRQVPPIVGGGSLD